MLFDLGNTLICSGANGRFFEVTPENNIVWEYVNPHKTNDLFAYTVFRAHRYAPDYCKQFNTLSPAKGSAIVPPNVSTYRVNGTGGTDNDDVEDGPTMHSY